MLLWDSGAIRSFNFDIWYLCQILQKYHIKILMKILNQVRPYKENLVIAWSSFYNVSDILPPFKMDAIMKNKKIMQIIISLILSVFFIKCGVSFVSNV
jgi:hypothetical protein